MKKIQVFEPALCCRSGVCGVDVDQKLVNFSADIDWARLEGCQVDRFNLANTPGAFSENKAVKDVLMRFGVEALPLTLLDGEVAVTGRYPNRDELALWMGATAVDIAPPARPASGCCSGGQCG